MCQEGPIQSVNPRVRLLLFLDDVNRGFLGGGCASTDTDVLSDQLCLCVFAEPLVGCDKPTGSRTSKLDSLRKFGLTLGFVGALPLICVERGVDPRCRILLFRRRAHGC
jgi:hypothetical protein